MKIAALRALAGASALALSVTAAVFTATVASAQTKPASDVHIIFVTHGQAVDPYWSVVKKGVEDGQKAMGSKVTTTRRKPSTWWRWRT